MKYQQCVIDLAIVLVTFPALVVVALLLEYTMNHTDWADRFESQVIVLGLAVAFFVICIIAALYLTHRIGVCLWTGPLPGEHLSVYSVDHDVERGAAPPDYDTILLDPPPYDKLEKYLLIDEPPPSYAASVASLEGAHI
ncbi:uncharacterized protein LOC129740654 [Uranotaenia lowii]|uniref:uncharacterized protein LOC129740654 n=1 Tax=Uranotaenia lowii TaxID=190385 RepID=UPI00247A46FF|nr:uncharacterized protein LOC129740654 [Uranotaenia lowii]XP_055588377.1 uncharacterized protein LOC129740654 [Uranotaenia lowii]